MRVLLFRNLCDRGGVATSMLLLGREMEKRGIECEFWFCKGSDRLQDFLETGRTTVGPLAKLAARLERADVDVVQMTASDPMAEVVAMMSGDARGLGEVRAVRSPTSGTEPTASPTRRFRGGWQQ